MAVYFNNIDSLNNENIEKWLRKCSLFFLILIFVATIDGAFTGYVFHNGFKIGDWLINYQGGMVRRGLLGELVYRLSGITPLDPGLYVFILQVLFYAVFFVFSYLLLKRQTSLLPYVFLIFSPFIFTFQLNDLQGGYRKEIVYFAIMAFVTYSARVYESRIFERLFYVILLCYPAVVLIHEMLAIFLPYLLAVYVSTLNLTKKRLFTVVLLLLPAAASTLVSLYYSGGPGQATAIFESLEREGYAIKNGAIAWLGKSTAYGMENVFYSIRNEYYLVSYFPVLLLSLIAFIPIRKNLGFVFERKFVMALVLTSIVGSVSLFVVALDWGRFIYIHLVSLFLLSLLAPGPQPNNNEQISEKIIGMKRADTYMIAAFFILYSMAWYIPHYGNPPKPYVQSVNQINVVSYVRPYVKYIQSLLKSE